MGRVVALIVVVALVAGGVWWWKGRSAGGTGTNVSVPETDPYTAGKYYYGKGQYESAIAKFKEGFEKDPKNPAVPEAKFQLARCYDELKRNDEAVAAYKEYLDKYPGDGSERISQAKARYGLLSGKGVD